MRILFIVPSYKPAFVYGGPIESVAKLCEGLVVRGHAVDVLTTTANGETELEVVPGKIYNLEGVSVTYFERITKDHTHVSPKLWIYLLRSVHRYDVIHIQSWWSILVIVAAYITTLKRIPTVISPRGMLSNYVFTATNRRVKSWIHKLVGKRVLQKSILHATAQSELLECQNVVPGTIGFEIPNILSLPDVSRTKKPNDVFTLLFLSRIHPKKNIELLIRAMAVLEFDVRLRIAGSGASEYVESLTALANQVGVERKIEWLGWRNREQKFEDLQDADLMVLVSQNENFANVVVESLHMGTPVVISNNVALSDFVAQTSTGWVTDLSVQSVSLAISNAYKDNVKRDFVKQNGRKIIEANFSEKALLSRYEEMYKAAVKA